MVQLIIIMELFKKKMEQYIKLILMLIEVLIIKDIIPLLEHMYNINQHIHTHIIIMDIPITTMIMIMIISTMILKIHIIHLIHNLHLLQTIMLISPMLMKILNTLILRNY
jgi:hypothetical protein